MRDQLMVFVKVPTEKIAKPFLPASPGARLLYLMRDQPVVFARVPIEKIGKALPANAPLAPVSGISCETRKQFCIESSLRSPVALFRFPVLRLVSATWRAPSVGVV